MILYKGLVNTEGGDTFRIHRGVHYFIGQLMPLQGETPTFVQIYIYDGTPEDELENRLQHLEEVTHPELSLQIEVARITLGIS